MECEIWPAGPQRDAIGARWEGVLSPCTAARAWLAWRSGAIEHRGPGRIRGVPRRWHGQGMDPHLRHQNCPSHGGVYNISSNEDFKHLRRCGLDRGWTTPADCNKGLRAARNESMSCTPLGPSRAAPPLCSPWAEEVVVGEHRGRGWAARRRSMQRLTAPVGVGAGAARRTARSCRARAWLRARAARIRHLVARQGQLRPDPLPGGEAGTAPPGSVAGEVLGVEVGVGAARGGRRCGGAGREAVLGGRRCGGAGKEMVWRRREGGGAATQGGRW